MESFTVVVRTDLCLGDVSTTRFQRATGAS
jgi:hypothetical protein